MYTITHSHLARPVNTYSEALISLTGSTVVTLHMNDQCTVLSIMPYAIHVREGRLRMLKRIARPLLRGTGLLRRQPSQPITRGLGLTWLHILSQADEGVIGWSAWTRRKPVRGRDTFKK